MLQSSTLSIKAKVFLMFSKVYLMSCGSEKDGTEKYTNSLKVLKVLGKNEIKFSMGIFSKS